MTSSHARPTASGAVDVPADKLWGAQTQRSLSTSASGHDLMPREMITELCDIEVSSAAVANHAGGRLNDTAHGLILRRRAMRYWPANITTCSRLHI